MVLLVEESMEGCWGEGIGSGMSSQFQEVAGGESEMKKPVKKSVVIPNKQAKMLSRFFAAKYLFLVDRTETSPLQQNHISRMKKIGELMRVERQSSGSTLRGLAHRMGISASYLMDMEKGNRMYSHDWQKKAEKAMKVK